MKVARHVGLYFNSAQSTMNQNEIHFFEAVFTKNGLQSIKSLLSPKNIAERQKVLGIITYLAPLIPRLCDLTVPLNELLTKDSEYKWSSSHQKSLLQ